MNKLGLACKIRVKKYKTYKGEYGKTVKNLLLTKTVDTIKHKTYYTRNFITKVQIKNGLQISLSLKCVELKYIYLH